MSVTIEPHDALLVVDVQRDFLPGGKLGVPDGDRVIPALNRYIALARQHGIPVVATRDWHPSDHCSFAARGGPWPEHCVANTAGAEFAPALQLPKDAIIVSKATRPDEEAYSAFQGTGLAQRLHDASVKRLLIGGLATDYCVRHSVKDALAAGFEVLVLEDAMRAVDVQPEDGARAVAEMKAGGAVGVRIEDLE
ncbi:MAG: nicotinamidase [Rhodospirillaceae bacterium]